jgi:hypothetical protein
MIKALLLLLDPETTWGKIEQSRPGVASVLFGYVLPLLLLGTALETWGMMKLGHDEQGLIERRVNISRELAMRYATVQVGLGLVMAFGGAGLFKKLSESFHRKHTYSEAFTTLGYSLGLVFLVRALDGIPFFNTWICWGIGALLGVSVLYRGIPRLMKPDPSNALGVYLTCSFLLLALTGIAHYVGQLVLQEKLLQNLKFG